MGWTMKKGNAENPEQTQNNTEKSKCNLCNKEFASEERLGIHKAMCKEKLKTNKTKNYRDIKNTTYEPPKHKEPIKIKNTEKNIETKIHKIEENEPMEIKIEKLGKKIELNEIPKIRKDIKSIKAADKEQEDHKEELKKDENKEEVKTKDQKGKQLENLQNLM